LHIRGQYYTFLNIFLNMRKYWRFSYIAKIAFKIFAHIFLKSCQDCDHNIVPLSANLPRPFL
jgi:hypothetical protein